MKRLSSRLWLLASLCFVSPMAAQVADRTLPASTEPANGGDKRIFGIIPNYRTTPTLANYRAISSEEKFKLAAKDAFDPGTFLLAAVFAGEGQVTNASPSFGQGVKGYGHYFITSYADWAGADFMTEAVYPALLHQDPRYFRKATGSGFSRLGHAVGQIFWTRTDSGGHTFNVSEIGGNATMVAISQAYYPDNRSAHDAAKTLAIQVGDDMLSNILKEFYPDLRRVFSRKHHTEPTDAH